MGQIKKGTLETKKEARLLLTATTVLERRAGSASWSG